MRRQGFLHFTIILVFLKPWLFQTVIHFKPAFRPLARLKNETFTVCPAKLAGHMANPHFTSLLFDLWITWINQHGRRMKRKDRTNVNEAMHIYSGASLQKVRWPPKGSSMCEQKITGCPAAEANHLSPINSLYTQLDPLIFPHPHPRPKPSISPKQRRTEAFYNLLQVLVRLSGAERSNILSASLP